MNKAQMFFKDKGPTLLTIIASAGVICTTILAIKATPKAYKKIQDEKLNRYMLYKDEKDQKISYFDAIKIAWKDYLPTTIFGLATIFCIFGVNYLNIKKQRSLMSAYILLDNAFKKYKQKISETYGEDVDNNISMNIIKREMNENMENETLFFDFNSLKFFETTMHKVLQAECKAKEQFNKYGSLTLNQYYSFLGIDECSYGNAIGWDKYQMLSEGYDGILEFTYDRTLMTNGIICYNIITNVPPNSDIFCI